MTSANSVIASAMRLIEPRHRWLSNKRNAEMKVPTATMQVNPQFLAFFSRAAAIADAFY